MITVRRLAVLFAAVAGLLLGTAASALAQEGKAYLRLAHLSPDTPNVDVYVASVADPARSFVVPGVGYGAVSPYRTLPSGSYVVSMRGAGAPASSPAVISTTVDARAGAAYTVAGTGLSAQLGLSILDDRIQPPPPGRASVRVINGAVSAPSVDVGPAGKPPWAGKVEFGTDTAYVEVPLGTWNLAVTAAGRSTVTLPCQLDANSSYSVLLVDRGGALKAELLTDSAGSKVVPAGGVNTGYGGTAETRRVDVSVPAALAMIAFVVVGLLLARRSGRGVRAGAR